MRMGSGTVAAACSGRDKVDGGLVSLARRLLAELRADLWLATGGVLINTIVGSALVPRLVRWLSYRALGASIHTPSISPGLRIQGELRKVEVGARTYLNQRCVLEAVAPIRIGRDCAIGPEVMIVTSHHGRDEDGLLATTPTGREVVIGDRVWIGARTLVLPGARIGDDVVVGGGSVVSGHCERPGLYAGVPARLIRPTR